MQIDDTLIDYLGDLAHLSLSGSERARISADLSKITGYMNILSELDTDSVPEGTCNDKSAVSFRADTLGDSYDRKLLLSISPVSDSGMFAAPEIKG